MHDAHSFVPNKTCVVSILEPTKSPSTYKHYYAETEYGKVDVLHFSGTINEQKIVQESINTEYLSSTTDLSQRDYIQQFYSWLTYMNNVKNRLRTVRKYVLPSYTVRIETTKNTPVGKPARIVLFVTTAVEMYIVFPTVHSTSRTTRSSFWTANK